MIVQIAADMSHFVTVFTAVWLCFRFLCLVGLSDLRQEENKTIRRFEAKKIRRGGLILCNSHHPMSLFPRLPLCLYAMRLGTEHE